MQEEKEYLAYTVNEFKKLIEENELKQKVVQKNGRGDKDAMIEQLYKLENKRKSLEANITKPYFARIDFESMDDKHIDKCYIGKIGTINADNKIVTVDWRTPIASLYYDNSVGECSYIAPEGKIEGNLLLKRQYNIENGKLISFQNVETVSSDELLNECLNASVDDRLKNIVATIQKEQNDIIRMPIEKDIIVQGVAGSGKTTVALHRIAYLVYQNRKHVDISQYMVIGPNKFFINYISSVLPDLDVNGVPEYDLLGFTNNYVNENIKLTNDVDTKLTQYKMSMEYKNEIDNYINKLNDLVVPEHDLEMFGFSILSRSRINSIYKKVDKEVNSIVDKVERTIMFIQKEIDDNRDNILVKANEYMASLFDKETDHEKIKAIPKNREKLCTEIKNGCSNLLKKYFNVINDKTTKIYSNMLQDLEFNEYNKIKYEDLVGLLYLRYRIVGNHDYLKYRHVVIDEAQDYGEFLFYVFKKIMCNSTFSVFGDLAQTIYRYRNIETWSRLMEVGYDDNIKYMKKSYRTTIEIMTEANKINRLLNLPIAEAVIRHGPPVKTVNNIDILSIVNELLKKDYKTIAIISKDAKDSIQVYDDLKKKIDIKLINDKSDNYVGGVVSLTSSLSKGLEFDAVIIYKGLFESTDSIDMKLLYVSMTRALHELIVANEVDK